MKYRKRLKTAYEIARVTVNEYLEYRLNFILWRFRSFVFFLSLVFLWLAVYSSQKSLFGYTKDQMLTYVIGIALLNGIVFGTRTHDIAGQIKSGELTRLVLLPINSFFFWAARDLADKLLNLGFAITEVLLVITILDLHVSFPHHPLSYLNVFLLLIPATVLYFYASLFLSFVAFWTDDIWAIRWLIGFILFDFLSGGVFPLEVFPSWLVKILSYTPFPYLVYYPLQIWLEHLTEQEILQAFLVCILWTMIIIGISRVVWQKGARNYGAYGG